MKGLADLVRTLRGENGCPWDKKQTPATIARYLIEEVYELTDTIESGDTDAICEELGDVLFLVFFMARLFEETGHFNIQDVMHESMAKMIRRHPHVFGESQAETVGEIRAQWHRIKKQEKKNDPPVSILHSIPSGLPALMRAYRVSERAAAAGFDWDNLNQVLLKVEEEWGELKEALDCADAGAANLDEVMLEFGDLIFTLTNLARFARFHPETATMAAIRKFIRRFQWMEKTVDAQGRIFEDISRAEMEQLWKMAKNEEYDGSA